MYDEYRNISKVSVFGTLRHSKQEVSVVQREYCSMWLNLNKAIVSSKIGIDMRAHNCQRKKSGFGVRGID